MVTPAYANFVLRRPGETDGAMSDLSPERQAPAISFAINAGLLIANAPVRREAML